MHQQLYIYATALGLTLPWTLFAIVLFRHRHLAERLVIGIIGGIAMTVSSGYLLAMWGVLDLYGYWYAVALGVSVLLLVANRKALRVLGDGPAQASPFAGPACIWFVVALLAILAAEAVPTFSVDFPIGWDPAFHSILSRKILDSNALAEDWRPFEAIEVNYSQGLHVWTALVSRASGQEVHQTLQVMHLVVQPLAAILVFLLASRLTRDWRAAILAMLSYAFLCNFGSFRSYYQWGGVPTEISSLLFLTIVWLSLTGTDRRSAVLRVLLFGSLILVHNLGAVIATAIMLFYALMTLLSRQLDDLARCFLRLFPWTLLAFSFYIVPYAMRAAGLESTDVLRYSDEAMMTWVEIARNLGYAVWALGALGLFLHSRRSTEREDLFLLTWVTSLVLCFCILGYGYRLAASSLYGDNFSALTPSRFLTVLSYPLAICAGFALSRLIQAAEGLLKGTRPLKRDLLMPVVALAIAAAAIPDVAELSARRSVAPEARQLGASVTAQTPDNAFIFYTPKAAEVMKPLEWIPYLTWRAAVYTPIPASEDRQTVREKRQLFRSGGSQIAQWLDSNGFEGFVLHRDPQAGFQLTRPKFE